MHIKPGNYHLFSSTKEGPLRPDRPLGASSYGEGPNRQVVAIPIVGPLPTVSYDIRMIRMHVDIV